MRKSLLLPLFLIGGVAQAAQPITGRWVTDNGKAVVSIERCCPALCGRIVRILAPSPNGPPVDERNPDSKLRHRLIQGLEVLSGLTDHGSEWRGRIYGPEAGKWYKSIIAREPGGFKAQGCILFFCRAQHWKPAP